MAEFKADLNPKTSSMSLYDLVKMNEYMSANKGKAVKPVAPVKPVDNVVKSSNDDAGTSFQFGNRYQSED